MNRLTKGPFGTGTRLAVWLRVSATIATLIIPASPILASPILVSGSYRLEIRGVDTLDPSAPSWHETVTGPVTGSFSDSVSESAPSPPNASAYGSSAGLQLTTSGHRIDALGNARAFSTAGFMGGPIVSAHLELELTFRLTQPSLVDVSAFSDLLSGKFGAASSVDLTPLPPDFIGNWDPGFPSAFTAVLAPGTYTVRALADASPVQPTGGSDVDAAFTLAMSFAPIPEASAALVFPVGLALAFAAIRLRGAR